MHHELKILPSFFQAVVDGKKNFEIRDNTDRGFNAGDTVELREHDPMPSTFPKGYSGRRASFVIGYVSTYEQSYGTVVFSLLPPNTHGARDE